MSLKVSGFLQEKVKFLYSYQEKGAIFGESPPKRKSLCLLPITSQGGIQLPFLKGRAIVDGAHFSFSLVVSSCDTESLNWSFVREKLGLAGGF